MKSFQFIQLKDQSTCSQDSLLRCFWREWEWFFQVICWAAFVTRTRPNAIRQILMPALNKGHARAVVSVSMPAAAECFTCPVIFGFPEILNCQYLTINKGDESKDSSIQWQNHHTIIHSFIHPRKYSKIYFPSNTMRCLSNQWPIYSIN